MSKTSIPAACREGSVPSSSLLCRFRSANDHKNCCRAYPFREELHSLYCDTWIPAACREGSVLFPSLLCRFLSANDHKNRCRAYPFRQELQSLSDTDTIRLCRSRRATPAAGPSLHARHKSGRRRYYGADSAAGRRRWRRALAAGAAAAAAAGPPGTGSRRCRGSRRLPEAGRSLSRRSLSCRWSRRRGGAVAKAAGGCCCFVAEAGRVAGRGAEAAGC